MDIHGSIHGCGYPWILPSKHIHMDVVRAIHGYPTGYPSTAITAYLRVVEPEKDSERHQKSCPDINCLDTQVGSIRTDHVRDCPLENNTAGMSV
jgi:hypothetical protein